MRTQGDILIEYRIEQGGAVATIKVRTWAGSAWGPADGPHRRQLQQATRPARSTPPRYRPVNRTASGRCQRAHVRRGADRPRLRIRRRSSCESFGSAILKSRSSDAFTSQLKDLIAPVPVNITNCGTVIIHKQTDPDEESNTSKFGYTKTLRYGPGHRRHVHADRRRQRRRSPVCSSAPATRSTENEHPDRLGLRRSQLHGSFGVTPTIQGGKVTFDIDDDTDVLECTYTNQARGTIIVEKITDDGTGSFDFTSGTLDSGGVHADHYGSGSGRQGLPNLRRSRSGHLRCGRDRACRLEPGVGDCDDGATRQSIGLSGGETVTCTFLDAREKGAIEITKTRKHAADGPGDHPHAGVKFTITGGELPAARHGGHHGR